MHFQDLVMVLVYSFPPVILLFALLLMLCHTDTAQYSKMKSSATLNILNHEINRTFKLTCLNGKSLNILPSLNINIYFRVIYVLCFELRLIR